MKLVEQLLRLRLDLVALRKHDPRILGSRQIVEHRGAAIVGEHISREEESRSDRSWRRERCVDGSYLPQRLDRVADELQADRLRFSGRKDVHDSASDGKLAVLVGRILAAEAGINQQFGQIGRRNLLSWPEVDGRRQQPFRPRDARHQGRGRGHDDARGSRGEAMERAGPGGGDADVRRKASIRVDFVGRQRQDRALGGRRRTGPRARTRRRRRRRRPVRRRRRPRRRTARRPAPRLARRRRHTASWRRRSDPIRRVDGASMPLRVAAAFKSARRLREVDVLTIQSSVARRRIEEDPV